MILIFTGMSTTATPIYCRIDAATKAALVGEQFLHGAILHAFSGRYCDNNIMMNDIDLVYFQTLYIHVD